MLDSRLSREKMSKRVSISALPHPFSDFHVDSWKNFSILVVEAIIQVFSGTSTPAAFCVRRSRPAGETPQAPVRAAGSLLSAG